MTIKAGECARVSVCRFGFVQVGLGDITIRQPQLTCGIPEPHMIPA
jgi:hypothetical protein